MAKNETHVLLVEGYGDRDFFEQVCKQLPLNPVVKVATSKDFQFGKNTKEDVFKLLPGLLKRIEARELERLAIVVDADKAEHGSGYDKTIARFIQIFADYDFALAESKTNGLLFKHADELADIGVWIMPNNQDEGILEDFIKECVAETEQPLFDHAIDVVENLPEPKKFAKHHYSKAEIATWLAWQKPPGHGFYYTVSDNLLNTDHPLFQEMQEWLDAVFAE
jgi:hypothetical protein